MGSAAQANVSKSYFEAIAPSISFVNNYPFAQEYTLAKSFLNGLGNELGTFQEGGRTYNYFGNRDGDWANENLLKDNLNSPAYRTFYDTFISPPSTFGQSLKQNWPTLLGQAVTLALGARGMATSPLQLSRAVAGSRNFGALTDAMLAEANLTSFAVTGKASWGRTSYSGNPSEPGFVGPPVPPVAAAGALADDAGQAMTVFRVQGGTPPLASRQLISIDENGNPRISRTTLNISIGDPTHAEYFLSKRPGANITSFDIPKWMSDFINDQAVPQAGYNTNPANQGGLAPKVVDPTTPGRSYELPSVWAKWLQEVAIPGSGKVMKGSTP